MKQRLFRVAMAIIFVTTLLSLKGIETHDAVSSSMNMPCAAGVSNLQASRSGSYVTFTWTGTGSPAYYTYGGYYNCYPASNPGPFPTGNTSNQSLTIYSPSPCGGRFGIMAYCAGGAQGTGTNILYY